jgi:hypothetical protein
VDSAGRARLALATGLAALMLWSGLRGYEKPVKEDWRGSAQFVARFLDAHPRCEGQRLVVWGGDPNVPDYAFYLGEGRAQLEPANWMRKRTRRQVARLVREQAERGCIALWAAFIDLSTLADLLVEMEMQPSELAVAPFHRAFVVSRRRPGPPRR